MRQLAYLVVFILTLLPLRGETLRVASFNVCNYLSMDRYTPNGFVRSMPKPEHEKSALFDIIKRHDPDILALQEMGPESYLIEMQEDLSALGLDYPYRYFLDGPDSDRHLAVLSKVKATEQHYHNSLFYNFFHQRRSVKRGVLELEFDGWTLFVLHLKSKWTQYEADPEAKGQRLAEATRVRNLIKKRTSKGSSFLIAGDFNDTYSSPALHRFTKGRPALTKRILAEDTRGELWTYFYKKQASYTAIDFFLVSEPMASQVRGNKAHIDDSLPQSIVASDHRMVYLDLFLRK